MGWINVWSSGANGDHSEFTNIRTLNTTNEIYLLMGLQPPLGAFWNGNGWTQQRMSPTDVQRNSTNGSSSYSGMSPLPTETPSGTYDSVKYVNIPSGNTYAGTWAWTYYEDGNGNEYTNLYQWEESQVLPEMSIKAGGVWKTGLPYIKVNGQWKQAEEVYIKLNGQWKQEG